MRQAGPFADPRRCGRPVRFADTRCGRPVRAGTRRRDEGADPCRCLRAARMVDVSGKDVTAREAVASGRVLLGSEVIALLRSGDVPKGDALGVARVAGIMAAKRTPDLVPLCHPLSLSGVSVDLEVSDEAVEIRATVRTTDRTGVEMEALTAVSVAALAVFDMVKAVDKTGVISEVRVEAKSGGRSGEWVRG